MEVILLSIVLFAVIMLAMAVGVIFKRPCLRGSCGGPDVVGPDGESLSCATCPNRKKRQARDAQGGLPVVR
ncbi:MAG: (Na+)-NQR maturation NqrM [Acidobacteriota bacterium]